MSGSVEGEGPGNDAPAQQVCEIARRLSGANTRRFIWEGVRGWGLSFCAPHGAVMLMSTAARRFIETLAIPTGPKAGHKIKLAGFQRAFIKGALAAGVTIGALSVARGNGKSALTAGLALGHLIGEIDGQVRRECLIGARTRDQGRVVYDYVTGLSHSLPDETRRRLTFRKAPRLEIEFEDDNGPHLIRVLASDGRAALGHESHALHRRRKGALGRAWRRVGICPAQWLGQEVGSLHCDLYQCQR